MVCYYGDGDSYNDISIVIMVKVIGVIERFLIEFYVSLPILEQNKKRIEKEKNRK